MRKYLLGFLKFLFYRKISKLSLVDFKSNLDRRTKIGRFAKVISSNIGKYTYISPRSVILDAEIGNFCSIASNCNIGLATHSIDFISSSPLFNKKNNATGYCWTDKNVFKTSERLVIGNDVWIGSGVKIMGGICIGDGAIIGAGAIVTKDIPPYSIAVGIPARVVRSRFSIEVINLLNDLKWWNLDDKILKENISLFQSVDIIESIHLLKKCAKRFV